MQSAECMWNVVFADCYMPSSCPESIVSICGKLLDNSNSE
jgi:hypothetical protein